jgi:hypothetical protein
MPFLKPAPSPRPTSALTHGCAPQADVFSFGVMMFELLQKYIMLSAISIKGEFLDGAHSFAVRSDCRRNEAGLWVMPGC